MNTRMKSSFSFCIEAMNRHLSEDDLVEEDFIPEVVQDNTPIVHARPIKEVDTVRIFVALREAARERAFNVLQSRRDTCTFHHWLARRN